MPRLLNESTSTSATTAVHLPAGEYKITLSTTDASVSIGIEESDSDLSIWRPVNTDSTSSTAVALTKANPAITYKGSGEEIRVTRTGGSAVATVVAKRINTGGL